MNNKLLKVVNPIMLISFLTQGLTGILMFMGFESKSTHEIHEYNGMLLIVIVAAHLYLNWGWIKFNLLNKK